MNDLHSEVNKASAPLIAAVQPQQGQPQMGQPKPGAMPAMMGAPQMGGGQPPQGQPQQGQGMPGQTQPGQPQQGRAQGGGLSINLAKYALPPGPLTDADLPKIKAAVDGACDELSEAIRSSKQKVDNEVIKSGLLGFESWLKRQGCISQASTRYAIESTDKYASQIFFTSPGTLAFDLDFKMAGNTKRTYRLLLFVSKVDLFSLASLVENKSLAGVPVPKGWPKNPWSFWTERP